MAVTAPSIGLGALQFSKELAAKYGLKSCLTTAVVPSHFQKCTCIRDQNVSDHFNTILSPHEKFSMKESYY